MRDCDGESRILLQVVAEQMLWEGTARPCHPPTYEKTQGEREHWHTDLAFNIGADPDEGYAYWS